jgi:hypothetical protein
MLAMPSESYWTDLAVALLGKALSVAKAFWIGLRSGL